MRLHADEHPPREFSNHSSFPGGCSPVKRGVSSTQRVPHGPLRVSIAAKFDIWWQESELYAYNPSQALQIALDKMLELAVEAGVVENRTANNSLHSDLKSAAQIW